MTNWIRRASFAAVIAAELIASQVAQSQTTPLPSSSPEPTEIQPSPFETPQQPAPIPSSTDTIACPVGQFPSVFSDVPPDHWAYQAVIQLASDPLTCFPDQQSAN